MGDVCHVHPHVVRLGLHGPRLRRRGTIVPIPLGQEATWVEVRATSMGVDGFVSASNHEGVQEPRNRNTTQHNAMEPTHASYEEDGEEEEWDEERMEDEEDEDDYEDIMGMEDVDEEEEDEDYLPEDEDARREEDRVLDQEYMRVHDGWEEEEEEEEEEEYEDEDEESDTSQGTQDDVWLHPFAHPQVATGHTFPDPSVGGQSLQEEEIGQELQSLTSPIPEANCRNAGTYPLGHPLWYHDKFARDSRHLNVYPLLRRREMDVRTTTTRSASEKKFLAGQFIPGGKPCIKDTMSARGYIGQFSPAGDLFVGAYQQRQRIKIYSVYDDWQIHRDIYARDLQWTVTDTALSHDQKFLIYSSINPTVHLVDIGNDMCTDEYDQEFTQALDFTREGARHAFGIWSVQFSKDSATIIAGTSDACLYVYDVERRKTIHRIQGHQDDVNAVAFASSECSDVIYTGSDDSMVQVWDRRTLGRSRATPVGVLPGHYEGIAFIDSKGDGRYLISNSKDQTIKLWDVRKMLSHKEHKDLPPARIKKFRWDYRWMDYPGYGMRLQHPHDRSIMTFRGHKVLQTLIRAYFSPMESTGQRFIYSGSYGGTIFIFDIVTGGLVSALPYNSATVRDCSWHPTLPMLASTSWDGRLVVWGAGDGGKTGVWRQRCALRAQ